MVYVIWSFLVRHLWWRRYRLRMFLALILFAIGVKPKSGIMCGSHGDELIDCGYFEIKDPKYNYFEVVLPLPHKIAMAYINRKGLVVIS